MKTQIKYLAIMFVCTFMSCTDETIEMENLDSQGISEKVFYTFDGEKYPLDVINNEGLLTLIENENLTQYDNRFENDSLVTYIDSENHDPLYFSNNDEYINYISDESKVAKRLEDIGLSIDNNVQSKSSSVPAFEIARHSYYRTKARIPVSSTYSNRHVGFNKCITGGIGFQDAISSIKVEPGLLISFYVRDNYRGKRLVIDNRYNSSTISLSNLHNYKRKRRSFINYTNNIVNINDLCGRPSLCKSWNDCITSIYAERFGYRGARNYRNVCSSGSGGGGSSGGRTGNDGRNGDNIDTPMR